MKKTYILFYSSKEESEERFNDLLPHFLYVQNIDRNKTTVETLSEIVIFAHINEKEDVFKYYFNHFWCCKKLRDKIDGIVKVIESHRK